MNILVTGLSGLIGGALGNRLGRTHRITGLCRSDVAGFEVIRADLQDYAAIRRAVEGRDVVIHLAAKAGEHFTWEELRDTNVEGTRHVFAAASTAGVPRVVFASSGATVSGWEREEPYRALVERRLEDLPESWPLIGIDDPPRPSGVYGSSKVWGEALARHFADTTETRFVNVRIGYVNAEDAPQTDRQRCVWCSQRDVVQALELAALAPLPERCVTFFANSANRYGYRDLEHGRRLFGFAPQDGAD